MAQTPLSSLGENAVLQRLLRQGLPTHEGLLVGPGDDCAVTTRDAQWDGLLKTDVVIEGIHFTCGTEPQRVGHKALARALSDIAAMGGVPEHALITLLVHPSRSVELLDGLYEGMNALARHYGVSLAGGETAALPVDGLAINVALTGRVEHGQAILRSGGKPGDILAVTGRLGGSFESGRHLDFMPCLKLARALVEARCAPRAMMDLSDGLACDLPRLARASGCRYELDISAIPCHEGCTPQQAMNDGEDYELLMAFAPRAWEEARQQNLPRPLTAIGHLLAEGGCELQGGWQHFHA